MSDVLITVVEDYDREGVAVFIDGDFLYGADPYHIDLYEFLEQLSRRKYMMDGVILERGETYGRPYEYFEDMDKQNA